MSILEMKCKRTADIYTDGWMNRNRSVPSKHRHSQVDVKQTRCWKSQAQGTSETKGLVRHR